MKTAKGLVAGALAGALSGCVLVAVSPLPVDGLEALTATVTGRALLMLAAIGAGGLAGGVLGAWTGRRREAARVHTLQPRRGMRTTRAAQSMAS